MKVRIVVEVEATDHEALDLVVGDFRHKLLNSLTTFEDSCCWSPQIVGAEITAMSADRED